WYAVGVPAIENGKRVIIPGEPALGFSLDGRTVLWHGQPREVVYLTSVKPDPTVLDGNVELGYLDAAVEYHARGWAQLARATLRAWYMRDLGWTPEQDLAWKGWEFWYTRLRRDPGTSLPLIAKYLKRILPDLDAVDIQTRRELVRSLELAVKPRTWPPGSNEAL